MLAAFPRFPSPPHSIREFGLTFATALFPLYQPVKGQALDYGRCVQSAGGELRPASKGRLPTKNNVHVVS